MATVEKRQRTPETKPTWRVRWREADGTERSKSFKKAGDARRWATEVEHSTAVGSYVDPIAGRVVPERIRSRRSLVRSGRAADCGRARGRQLRWLRILQAARPVLAGASQKAWVI